MQALEALNSPSRPARAFVELTEALKPLAIFSIVPVGLLLAGSINSAWIPTLTVDANQVAHKHPLVGMVSTMGILLWAATVAVCVLAASLLSKNDTGGDRRFFFWSTALTGYLMVDDWLQIHETLAPRYLGLPEIVLIGALGLAVLGYLWTFRARLVAAPERARFAVALICLGLSVAIDTVTQWAYGDLGHWEYLFEDGFKWMGIAAWLTFFWSAACQALKAQHRS